MRKLIVAIALVLVAGCKDKGTDKDKDPGPTKPDPAGSAQGSAAAQDDATRIAALPVKPVPIPGLGLELDAPEGTAITPERNADDAKRRAHLEVRPFMVNVDAVDEYSTPSFAKAKEVYEKDKLVEWYTSEEVGDGWITFKQVISDLHKGPRFEVNVRKTIAGKKWDCGVSAPDRKLAELTLAACKSLR